MTGWSCETCPFFERTPENIKSVRAVREYQTKKASEELDNEIKARAYYQAETDKEYLEQQKKNEEKKFQSAADEYAEYLRLKDKFEK